MSKTTADNWIEPGENYDLNFASGGAIRITARRKLRIELAHVMDARGFLSLKISDGDGVALEYLMRIESPPAEDRDDGA